MVQQRCSDGSEYRTDSFGTTRDNRGNSWRTDSFGTVMVPNTELFLFGTTRDNRGNFLENGFISEVPQEGVDGSTCRTDSFGTTRCSN